MRSEIWFFDRPILSLQRMLYLLSRTDADIPFVLPDGSFGPQTQAAVRAFQRQQGMQPTGEVDLATWEALANAYSLKLPLVEGAEPLVLLLDDPIHPGASSQHMLLVKAMLQALCSVFPHAPQQTRSTVHDEASVAAVRRLQALGGLPVTGILDKPTWRVLSRLYRTSIQSG